MNIQTLFDKAGTAARLASMIGVARTTVLDWKRTGFIPGNRVGQVSAALGIPTEDVLKLVQPGKTRSTAQQQASGKSELKGKRSVATTTGSPSHDEAA